LSAVEIKLTEMQENQAQKSLSQCYSTLNFWRQVPESKHPEFKIPVYKSFMCIAQHITVIFFLCNEVHKTIPSCNPTKWTLGRICTAL